MKTKYYSYKIGNLAEGVLKGKAWLWVLAVIIAALIAIYFIAKRRELTVKSFKK